MRLRILLRRDRRQAADGRIRRADRESATTKADLQKALAAAFAYCDKVYASASDNTAAVMVKGFWGELPKLSVLDFNTAHDFEHYGNIVTYMRLKDLVPPSSEPRK